MCRQDFPEPVEIHHTVLGYKIYHYKTISSTNDVAKKIAKNSREEKIVVVAETQICGRGRDGRQWISPQGGIWISIILRPVMRLKEALRLTFIMSSTVAKTMQSMFGLKAEVKWPNDVLVNGKKICGILAETSSKTSIVEFVILGVGVNANVDLTSFPADMQNAVTSLKHEVGYRIRRTALIKTLLQNFEHRYTRLQQGAWGPLLQEWKAMAAFLGKQVEVASVDENYAGKALDVDEDGALIIRLENGVLRRVTFGDVTVRRQG